MELFESDCTEVIFHKHINKGTIGINLLTKKVILYLVLIISVSLLSATEYYVSPNGSDENSGTIGAPFQTIQHAADLMQSGDNCYLRSGTYHEAIQINNLNGTSSDLITFTNYQDETVILDGTIPITSSWTVHDGNIYKTTLTEDIWQLFVDGEEMVMARWPNAGFVDGSIWDQEQHWAHGDEDSGSNGVMVDDPHDDVNLANSGIDMTGAVGILNVGSFRTWTRFVNSHGAGNNTFTYDPVPESDYRTKHQYYFLEKKLEFLDQESEWFFNHETNELYLWSPGNADPNNLNIRGKVQSYSFQITNSSYIELKGLHFFASTFKMDNSDYMVVDSSNFLYPSCYKRMLGVVDTEPEMTLITGSSNCTVSRCAFRYTDGSAIETSGGTNTIENCYFYHIDYTVTDLSSVMTTIRMGGSTNVFRQNTLHRTGASSGINPGDLSVVEYNDMYDTGYLQSDGAIVHLMEGQQPGSETRYNWLHDSPKYGVRFDGDGDGNNGLIHHNVIWNIQGGIMIKGYEHMIYNNTAFDNGEKNDIIVLIDCISPSDVGGNEGTITRNNAADKISGHRQDSYQDYPVPGIYDHNWNGYETGGNVRDLLISPPAYENVEDYSPDQYDFQPNPDSELIDAGLHVEGITDGYVGSAPDQGAYEYGGENWTPGVTWDVSSYQLWVVADAGDDIVTTSDEDGSATVTLDGSGSYDPNGDALTYSWTLDGTVVSTDVSFNYNLNVGIFTFTLTVSNSELTASDDVVVIVNEYVDNSALSFTAANEDYVDCGNDPELQLSTHDLTIEFWLKTSAGGVKRIVGNGGTTTSDDGYSIWILGNGKIRAGFSDGTTSEAKQNETVVNDGNWHHCAVVFDRDDVLWVCVDGTCATKPIDTLSDLNCDNINDTFVLGRKSTTNSAQSYTGSLDEVRIWNTALDTSTVFAWQGQELTSLHPNISNLQAYYKFNEGSGSTANDLTADYLGNYESDGAITGTEWVASDIPNFTLYDDEDLQEGGSAPSAPSLTSPSDSLVISLTFENLYTDSVVFVWESSADPDGDAVMYRAKFGHIVYSGETLLDTVKHDSTMAETSIVVFYEDFNEDLVDLGGDNSVLKWNVAAIAGSDTVLSDNGPRFVLVDGTSLSVDEEFIPTEFALHQNYPNPFNPVTTIQFDIPKAGEVRLDVYNLLGKKVATLVQGRHEIGGYKVGWDAAGIASGIYYYRISSAKFTSTKKMILMK